MDSLLEHMTDMDRKFLAMFIIICWIFFVAVPMNILIKWWYKHYSKQYLTLELSLVMAKKTSPPKFLYLAIKSKNMTLPWHSKIRYIKFYELDYSIPLNYLKGRNDWNEFE